MKVVTKPEFGNVEHIAAIKEADRQYDVFKKFGDKEPRWAELDEHDCGCEFCDIAYDRVGCPNCDNYSELSSLAYAFKEITEEINGKNFCIECHIPLKA